MQIYAHMIQISRCKSVITEPTGQEHLESRSRTLRRKAVRGWAILLSGWDFTYIVSMKKSHYQQVTDNC